MFRWLKAGRSNQDPRLAELVGPLYAAALRLTGDPASAEDLVVRAYRIFDGMARGGKRAGAPDIALFAALYAARQEAAGPLIGPKDLQGASNSFVTGPAGTRGSPRGDLTAALDGLPGALWHPLWLRDNRGFEYGEIAFVLDVTPSVVATLISRARRRLAAELRGAVPDFASGRGR